MKIASSRQRRLLTGSATAVVIAVVLGTAPAHAENACGDPVDGVVECGADDAPFTDGIFYLTPGNLTLNLQDKLKIETQNGYEAIGAYSESGSVTINGAGADVVAGSGSGISTQAAGDVSITINDVTASQGHGIGAYSSGGDVNITAGDVIGWTSGITVFSEAGDVNINAESVTAKSGMSSGVLVYAGGDINVSVGKIDVSGDYSAGAVARGTGNVSVTVGDATIRGYSVAGIGAITQNGAAVAKVGSLVIEGTGNGVLAYSDLGDAHAEVGKVSTRGDETIAVWSFTYTGNATAIAGEVTTSGDDAIGVEANSAFGNARGAVGSVTTDGNLGIGVRIRGQNAELTATGKITTHGDNSAAIMTIGRDGNATARISGPVTTHGYQSWAVALLGRNGKADATVSGKVSTAGNDSIGINMLATSPAAEVKLVAGEVSTSGTHAHGVKARTWYQSGSRPFGFGDDDASGTSSDRDGDINGDIHLKVEKVTVTGAGSLGVTARGFGNASLDIGSVSSFDVAAIDTDMVGTASIKLRGGAKSTKGSAIVAKAQDIAIAIAGGATVEGGEHGILVDAVGRRSPEDEPGVDPPAPTGASPSSNDSSGTVTITNAGTIKGGSGYSVKVGSGTLALSNTGTIVGAVSLGDGNDVIDNSGTFEVTKDSDFGGGRDLFKNSGTVKIAGADSAKSYSFLNLERFENSGLVDLRNGQAGDTFTLSGDYAASGAAKLGLDVDFAAGVADKLSVAGAATGKTEISLAAVVSANAARATSSAGIELVEVGAGSEADAFSISKESQQIGFVNFALSYDAAQNRYLLKGRAGANAFRQLNVMEGADAIWHASSQPLYANAGSRGAGPEAGSSVPRRNGVWGQFFGGKATRGMVADEAGANGDQSVDYSYEQSQTGGQLGWEMVAAEADFGTISGGLTGGYSDSELRSSAVEETTRYSSWNAGAYAHLKGETVFASLIAKYDRHKARIDSSETQFSERVSGSTLGLAGEVGARFGGRRLSVEPLAGLAWTRTSLDDVEALGHVIDFDTATGLRGRVGARLAGDAALGGGDSLRYFVRAMAVKEFGKDYRAVITSNSTEDDLSSDRIGSFGEGAVGLSYVPRAGLEAFLEGEGRRGSDYDAINGRLGVRVAL